MNAAEIQTALDNVFDQALLYHGYTDYMRDYELVVHAVSDQRTGIPPAYLRYLFRNCVEADIRSALSARTWRASLDDRLIDHQMRREQGFVWGVRWQELYPGGKVIEGSERAREYAKTIGIDFHEIRIKANAHVITLVVANLEVSQLDLGYTPFVLRAE